MSRSASRIAFAVSSLSVWVVAAAQGHPASGITVNEKGEVFFIHTGRGVVRIDSAGKSSVFHRVAGGGHFLAWDATGQFENQFPRLIERVTPGGTTPALLYASGGAPFVVHRDGNLYYGSGFPEGEDDAPGGLTLARLSPEGKRTLFAPTLKRRLAAMKEAVTGLAAGPDGSLFVACPAAVLKVGTDGAAKTVVDSLKTDDGEDVFGAHAYSPFFHGPYLRGLALTDDGTIYAAATGRRLVLVISPKGEVKTALASPRPWTPTGVAVRGKEVFVLEYSHHEAAPSMWSPRVRRIGADGKVTVLVDLSRDEVK
jgi:DNA-binding beta-propeller fold protein YncE